MPNSYSEDSRLCVVMTVESGKTTREAGALYQSPGFVSKVHQLWKKTGTVQGKLIGGYRVPCWNRIKLSSGNSYQIIHR